MRKILFFFIQLYQKYLSPDHSGRGKVLHPYGYCKFYPTCSEYMKQSLKKYGLFKGISKGIWRILRCNPFSQGGIDMP